MGKYNSKANEVSSVSHFTNKSQEAKSHSSEPTPTLFAGGLSKNTTSDSLYYAFEKYKAKDARVVLDKNTGESKRFGFVDFESADDAKLALEEMNGQDLDGRNIRLDFSTSSGSSGHSSSSSSYDNSNSKFPLKNMDNKVEVEAPKSEPSECLFVGHLSYYVTDDTLKEAFAEFNPSKARVVKDKFSGESRGFGYVDFETVEEAQKAVGAMNGVEVSGRNIKLDYAKPSSTFDTPQKSFGGRGGGKGGRGGGSGGRGGFPRTPKRLDGINKSEGTPTQLTFSEDE